MILSGALTVTEFTVLPVSFWMTSKLAAGMLCGGVDVAVWPGGVVSSRHDADDVETTVTAFEGLLKMLADEGEL